MQKEQRCNVFNAITGKLESDVVVFLGFPNDFVFVLPMMPLPFFHKKSLSFISVLRGKCHFIFLLSASSVIQSKY